MATKGDQLLDVETRYFDEHANELLLEYPNRFLLIYGEAVIGNFELHADAVAEGVRRFGENPFLVRRTGDKAPCISAPALTLGLLQCQL